MARLCTEIGISESIILELKRNKIITVPGFLQEDVHKLSSLCNTTFKEMVEIRHTLISNFSALPFNGTYAYQHMLSNSALISSGIEKLDNLLGGGFLTGSVVEFCGLSGVGKTQLCLTFAANIASVCKQTIHYIDTKNNFSSQRVLNILKNRNNPEVCKCALECIEVIKICDLFELIKYLHHLRKSLLEEDINPPRMVIIDSVTPLFFPFLGNDSIQGFGLLNQMMASIKLLATEFHLIFIHTNLVSSYVDPEIVVEEPYGEEETLKSDQTVSEVQPMLGKYWLHAPHTRLLVTKLNNEAPQRLIRVIKSISLPLGASSIVCMSQYGVV